MKKFTLFLVLATAGFVAHQQGFLHPLYERVRGFSSSKAATEAREVDTEALGIASPDAVLSGANQQQASPPPPAEPVGRIRVACPACQGSGRYLLEGKGRMSRTQPCQVCAGRGHRSLFVQPGATICSTCSGMGRRHEMLDTGRMKSSACQQCVGRGTLRRR